MEGRLVVGRYRLIRPLGRGGMGAVWLGEDQLAGRQIAVKELRPPAGVSDAEQDIFRRRALAEARSAARLTHPNAVTLYDVIPASPADDAVYLIMEYVDGATLAQVIEREGPLSEPRAAGIALQMLSILDAAHALGIVHRDIKPANIMITAAGQVKLADFGIAHMVGGTRLTGSGVIFIDPKTAKYEEHVLTGTLRMSRSGSLQGTGGGKISVSGMALNAGRNGRVSDCTSTWQKSANG